MKAESGSAAVRQGWPLLVRGVMGEQKQPGDDPQIEKAESYHSKNCVQLARTQTGHWSPLMQEEGSNQGFEDIKYLAK